MSVSRAFLVVLAALACVSCQRQATSDQSWWTQSDYFLKSEPTELFFAPAADSNDRYWLPSDECCPEKAPVLQDKLYSTAIQSYQLRPIGALVNIPRNTIKMVRKPYQVWTGAIWDLLILEILLPNFEGRSAQNFDRFRSRSNPDLLEIRLGFLGGDWGLEYLAERQRDGRLVEVTDAADSKMQLRAFRSSSRLADSDAPTTYLGDERAFRSLTGNPVVISCAAWPSLGASSQRCEAHLSIPVSLWPQEMKLAFSSTGGLQVVYSFPKGHLANWPNLLERLDRFTLSLLPQVSHAK